VAAASDTVANEVDAQGEELMTETRFDPAQHAKAMRAGGFWIDKSYDEFLAPTIARASDKLALLAYRSDRADGRRFTYAELGDLISRAAASLRRLGIGPGDVVSVQLPNWWEFAVIALSAFRIGAVVNPLMPIFRERELSYMLEFAGSKALVVPKTFRGFDHEAMAHALKPALPKLQHILVVDGAGPNGFDAALLSGEERIGPPPVGDIGPLKGDAMAVLMFTSGTTGSPKGVMHCLNTLMACNVALAGRFGLDERDTMLVCSPLGHMTGFAAGMLLGLKIGASVIFQDVWEPKRGVTIMAEEGVTFSAGAATFLTDMCEAVIHGVPRPPRLHKFLCAGAPIPPVLIERVHREVGAVVCSLWGMTESLSSTLTEPERALIKSSTSDGRALDGVAVKVVRPDGSPAPLGETGALKVRGAQMALGYYKRPDMEPFDAEGWFDTGDLAYMDEEGYIRINGRTKDIIIRGGENVPIVEIEGLLFKHPAVLAVALVGYPDSRLGERACAFLTLRPGHTLDLAAVQAYMEEHKVAKQYWPERIVIAEDLPKTPAGKIQKFALREQAKAFGDAADKASA
jgi:cyclohexanecarboxylate-CoA ligase